MAVSSNVRDYSNHTEVDKFESAINGINSSIADYNLQLGRYDSMLKTYRDFIKQQNGISNEAFIQRTVDMEFLLKVNTQILISLNDLAIITKNLLMSNQKWESIFYSKSAYLTIYETLKKFSVFQRKLVALFSLGSNCRDDFFQTIQSLRDFKKTYGYETNLRLVRNKVAGHVDEDFESYFALSGSLDARHTLEIVSVLLPIFSAIQKQTTTLVQEEQMNLTKMAEDQAREIKIMTGQIEEMFMQPIRSKE